MRISVLDYEYMKLGCVVLVFLFCLTGMAQDARKAHATYSVNGVLIALSDLSPLMSCSVRSIDGMAKSVKEKNGIVTFDIKSKDSGRLAFRFPLTMLASAEQFSYKKNFLHKGLRLRASGYACGDGPYDAISIERVY